MKSKEEIQLRALVAAQERRLRAQGYRPRPAVKKAPAAIGARRDHEAYMAAMQERMRMQCGSVARLMASGMSWPMRAHMLSNPQLMAQLFARRPA